MDISLFHTFSIVVALAATFSYINHRFLKLPTTIGLMILALCLAGIMILTGKFSNEFFVETCKVVHVIDFRLLLMDIMLSFLLFAGALHVNAQSLKSERLPVFLFATFGVVLSTFLVGTGVYWLLNGLSLNISYTYCLLFGALISPTDPIAVLSILKEFRVSESLETKISGESLFNDGVGVVVFLSILMANETGIENFSIGETMTLLAEEALGGLLFGGVLGYGGYLILRTVTDSAKIEVLVTIAITMGGYALASLIHVSGPLAMVVAGLIIGNKILATDKTTKAGEQLSDFWEMLDESLNAVLFVLIGLEVISLPYENIYLLAGVLAIFIVLLSRVISVAIPVVLIQKNVKEKARSTIAILTWGGLRGGISIALALSLPQSEYRDLIVLITYVVVVFSIIFQGLSIGALVKKLKLGV
ncbi:MAG: sodium:proton antiporter [Bacteroidota bacterium]